MAFQRQTLQNYETKAAIVRGLNDLLSEKPYDKVSIVDICERSSVSKSTFYRNFHDKPSVVEWYTQHLLGQTVAKIGGVFGWRDAFILFFREMRESKTFFCSAAQAKGHRSIRRSNRRTAIEDLLETVAPLQDEDLNFQARYFATVMVDVICDWIEDDMKTEPTRMADLLLTLLPSRLESAFLKLRNSAQSDNPLRIS